MRSPQGAIERILKAFSIRKDKFKSKNVKLSSESWLARRDRVKEATWETLDSFGKTWVGVESARGRRAVMLGVEE